MQNNKEFEMGYTPSEFRKTLQGQFSLNTKYTIQELSINHWLITHQDEPLKVDINISKNEPRKIAMLTLPVLNTHFRFIDASESQLQEFLKTFFKYFHKGGG